MSFAFLTKKHVHSHAPCLSLLALLSLPPPPQFVYEPHIAPTIEAWAEDFLERRRAARNRHASTVPVRTSRRRGSSSSSDSSHQDNDPHRDRGDSDRVLGPNDFSVDDLELEALASREVHEWRNEVLRSQQRSQNGLRRRKTDRPRGFDSLDSASTTLDEVSARCCHSYFLAPSI